MINSKPTHFSHTRWASSNCWHRSPVFKFIQILPRYSLGARKHHKNRSNGTEWRDERRTARGQQQFNGGVELEFFLFQNLSGTILAQCEGFTARGSLRKVLFETLKLRCSIEGFWDIQTKKTLLIRACVQPIEPIWTLNLIWTSFLNDQLSLESRSSVRFLTAELCEVFIKTCSANCRNCPTEVRLPDRKTMLGSINCCGRGNGGLFEEELQEKFEANFRRTFEDLQRNSRWTFLYKQKFEIFFFFNFDIAMLSDFSTPKASDETEE